MKKQNDSKKKKMSFSEKLDYVFNNDFDTHVENFFKLIKFDDFIDFIKKQLKYDEHKTRLKIKWKAFIDNEKKELFDYLEERREFHRKNRKPDTIWDVIIEAIEFVVVVTYISFVACKKYNPELLLFIQKSITDWINQIF